MTINTIIPIAVILTLVITLTVGAIFYFRDKSLDDIRADVYQLFLEIERNPAYYKTGKDKMKWVLARAKNYLPLWAQVFITDAFLEKVVQGWFDAVKDLLDDGKLNKSLEEKNAN